MNKINIEIYVYKKNKNLFLEINKIVKMTAVKIKLGDSGSSSMKIMRKFMIS